MHLLLVSLLSLVSFSFVPQQDFRVYSSVEGAFSAEMPADLHTNVVITETAKGRLFTHIVSATDADLNEYMISWTQYEKDGESRATPGTLDRMRDGLVKAKEGTITNEPPISLNGHPARAVNFTYSNGRVVHARFYFVGTRVYQVVFESRSNQYSAVMERFLDSFKVVNGK